MDNPKVSIMIPNFNHSKYLDECIMSAINQTYFNIEIVILDNVSDDNSMEIAQKYMYDSRVRVCRNCKNLLNNSYLILDQLTTGKYKMMLCADDFIEKTFVEKAVSIMEKYPNVGYVHCERDFITEKSVKLELDFFYNCSFVVSGKNVMPIYMMTTVAHPSQGIFRTEIFHKVGGYEMEIDHMNADKMLWFYLSYEADYAYIREKLCNIRIGEQTETVVTQKNFQHPILCHLTLKEMIRFAQKHKLPEVYTREKEAIKRLADDFLNYAAVMLKINEKEKARRYLEYAALLSEDIIKEEYYIKLSQIFIDKDKESEEYLEFVTRNSLQKKRNYEPPKGYYSIS